MPWPSAAGVVSRPSIVYTRWVRGVVVDEVAAPADSGDERVGDAERRSHRDGCVGGAAAAPQHAQPGIRGDRAV